MRNRCLWPTSTRQSNGFGFARIASISCFSVCAAPAHLLGKGFALAVIDILDRFDQLVMKAQPRFRRFAWLTMLDMEK